MHTILQNNAFRRNGELNEKRCRSGWKEATNTNKKEDELRKKYRGEPLAENKPGALTVRTVTGIITPPNN